MDKQTLSNYGWIVITVLVLAVMIALATPFGEFIANGFKATYTGFSQVTDNAFSVIGLGNDGSGGEQGGTGTETPDTNQLTTPNISIVGDTLTINAVENATSYEIYNDDTLLTTTSDLEVDLSKFNLIGGTHIIRVLALADGYETSNVADAVYENLAHKNLIPVGGTYTVRTTSEVLVGDGVTVEFPSSMITGDTYTYGEYKYTYQIPFNGWKVDINTDITDKNQTTYGTILESINGKSITSMINTFQDCSNLIKAPAIPSTVTNINSTFYNCTSLTDITNIIIPSGVTEYMKSTFSGCTALTDAGNLVISKGVTNMESAFFGCTSLKTAPDLSNCTQLTNMQNTFFGCTSLTGTIIINATPTLYENCFYGVDMTNINLTGDCPIDTLNLIGLTGKNFV